MVGRAIHFQAEVSKKAHLTDQAEALERGLQIVENIYSGLYFAAAHFEQGGAPDLAAVTRCKHDELLRWRASLPGGQA